MAKYDRESGQERVMSGFIEEFSQKDLLLTMNKNDKKAKKKIQYKNMMKFTKSDKLEVRQQIFKGKITAREAQILTRLYYGD